MKINVSIFIILFTVIASGSVAQSLKGKAWQSQDTANTSFKPKTLVFNTDGTCYQISFYYLKAGIIYPLESEPLHGKYTLEKNDLNISLFAEGKPSRLSAFQINWKSNDQFVLIDGNKTYFYAELGSKNDQFSRKLIIPYLKKSISKNEKIDPCYQCLTSEFEADTLRLKEEYAIRSQASEKVKASTEKFCSSVKGKAFKFISPGLTLTYDFKMDGTYNRKEEQSSADEKMTIDENGIYTEEKDLLTFERATAKEVHTYPNGGMTSQKFGNQGDKFQKNVIWVNDFIFRMKIGNLTYLFTAQK